MVASDLDDHAPVLVQEAEPAAIQVDRQGIFPRAASTSRCWRPHKGQRSPNRSTRRRS